MSIIQKSDLILYKAEHLNHYNLNKLQTYKSYLFFRDVTVR